MQEQGREAQKEWIPAADDKFQRQAQQNQAYKVRLQIGLSQVDRKVVLKFDPAVQVLMLSPTEAFAFARQICKKAKKLALGR
jgi:hypothetical protein